MFKKVTSKRMDMKVKEVHVFKSILAPFPRSFGWSVFGSNAFWFGVCRVFSAEIFLFAHSFFRNSIALLAVARIGRIGIC